MAKYRFEQIAINSTEKKKPVEADRFTYLGLEHLDSGSLKVTRFGSEVAPVGEKLVMHKGDVLFGKRRAYQKKVAIAPFDGIFSAHGMVLRPKEEVIDKNFFPLFISSDYFLDAAIKISVGSLSPTINWRDLKDLEFELPDLDTQRRLAEVLSSINDTTEAYKKLIAKTDELVKSQFMEQFDGPLSNKIYKVEPLKNNATLLNGRAYRQNELLNAGKYPVLRVGNFFSNDSWYYSDLELEDDKYCLKGDLLYAWSATFGPKIWDGDKVIYHYHIWKVCVGDAYDKLFLCKLLEYASEKFGNQTHGTTMLHLTKAGIENTSFIVPPLPVQERFAAFVRQSDKSKFAALNCSNLNLLSSLHLHLKAH